ncbi:MAG: hypothetical protein ACREC9_14630 [Methylocella sp.]
MKKLTAFLGFGAVLAAGLPGQAMAADVVLISCSQAAAVGGVQNRANIPNLTS